MNTVSLLPLLLAWLFAFWACANLVFGSGAKRIGELGELSGRRLSDEEIEALQLRQNPGDFFALSAYFFVGGLVALAGGLLRCLKGGVERCDSFPKGLALFAKRFFKVQARLQGADTRGVVDEERGDREDEAANR